MQTALEIIRASLRFGINPSLEPITQVCKLLGNPQQQYRCIQVAGTNGKSSTSRYIAALLGQLGYSTGLYTSPELVSITERVEIKYGISKAHQDTHVLEDEEFAQAVIHVHTTAQKGCLELTEFELITAAAFVLFAQAQIDYAILEVGLGGRWDATSVVHPVLAVFTGVDLEHTSILGNTIAQIASEKAAVIKPGSLVVTAPTHREALDVFKAEAVLQGARFIELEADSLNLIVDDGSYQAQNKLTALKSVQELLGPGAISCEHALATLNQTVVPGRFETVYTNPLIIIDAAHNPASALTLASSLRGPMDILLLAVLDDKDATGIIQALALHFNQIVVTQTSSSRSVPAQELVQFVESETGTRPQAYATVRDALTALLLLDKSILATGSITLAGEVKRLLASKPRCPLFT